MTTPTQLAAAFRLDGRSALVTGAGGGVGAAVAHAFAAAGLGGEASCGRREGRFVHAERAGDRRASTAGLTGPADRKGKAGSDPGL